MRPEFIPLEEMDITFVDVETTGLNPALHEIVDISMIRQDSWGREKDRWTSKIRPVNLKDAEARALEINGYNQEDWAGAPFFPEVKDRIIELWRGALLCGHNGKFDFDFLMSEFGRCGITLKDIGPGSYHILDTVTLAYSLLGRKGLIKTLSLRHIRPVLHIPEKGSHQALKDTEDARAIWNYLQDQIDRDVELGGRFPTSRTPDKIRKAISYTGKWLNLMRDLVLGP